MYYITDYVIYDIKAEIWERDPSRIPAATTIAVVECLSPDVFPRERNRSMLVNTLLY